MRDERLTVRADLAPNLGRKIDQFAQENNLSRNQAVNLILNFSADIFIHNWTKFTKEIQSIFIQQTKEATGAKKNL